MWRRNDGQGFPRASVFYDARRSREISVRTSGEIMRTPL
jgi:hypothetical protein